MPLRWVLLLAEMQQSLHRQRLRQQAISAELPDISEEPEPGPASASGLTSHASTRYCCS